jgi:hypothetical protein
MDSRTLVVQVVRGGQSDLEFYDLKGHRLRQPPRGVNTRQWEWRGSISGRWLLFGRVYFGGPTYKVVLYDLRTRRQRILESVTGHEPYAEPGKVAGDYAVWARCPYNFCTIYRYRIRPRHLLRLPSDYGHAVYAPSVTSDGDVYYGRGLWACGAQVELMRYRPHRGPRVVLKLAQGYDFRFTDLTRVEGQTRVYFDRVRCDSDSFDIFTTGPLP